MDRHARQKDHALLHADCPDVHNHIHNPPHADTAYRRLRADHHASWDDVFAATMAVMYGRGGGGAERDLAPLPRGPHGEHVEHVENAPADPPLSPPLPPPPPPPSPPLSHPWPCRVLRRAQRLAARWCSRRRRSPEKKAKAEAESGEEGGSTRRPRWRGCM